MLETCVMYGKIDIGGGGKEYLGGEVRPSPSYPNPVQDKFADFPTLIKTEFRFWAPSV